MSESSGERKQLTFDSDGVQYIFAYKTCDGWEFPRHRFQVINPDVKSGQFISSMWYSNVFSLNENLEFLVVGVKGAIDYRQVTSLVNGSLMSYGSNILSRFEKSCGIEFKDYYIYSSEKCTNLYNNYKNEDGFFNIYLSGTQGSILNIAIKCMDDGLHVTTPSFEINSRDKITTEASFDEWDKKIDVKDKSNSLFKENK
jgi:hypothetical protein